MIYNKILMFILLALSTIYISGTKATALYNDNQDILQTSTDTSKCLCFKNTGPDNDIIATTFPPGHEVERLIVVLYRDVNNNNLVMYIPRFETQNLIPDLAYNNGDELKTVSEETVRNIFLRSLHKTTEKKYDFSPIIEYGDVLKFNGDLETSQEEIILDADVTKASQNEYKLSFPDKNTLEIYDYQQTYDIPALSQYTSHEVTPLYKSQQIRYDHLSGRLKNRIGVKNLKLRPVVYRNKISLGDLVIRNGKIITSVKKVPYIQTVSFTSPNSYGNKAVPIGIELSDDTIMNSDYELTLDGETISTSKSHSESDTGERHKNTFNDRNVIDKQSEESNILRFSSNVQIRRTGDMSAPDITVLEGNENNSDLKNAIEEIHKPEDKSIEISLNDINNSYSSVKPLDDDASISVISLTDTGSPSDAASRRSLNLNAANLNRRKIYPKNRLSVKPLNIVPVYKNTLDVLHESEIPFINRRVGRTYTPDDADTQYYRRGLRPDEDILNRADVYSKSDLNVGRTYVPDFRGPHNTLDMIPAVYSKIIGKKSPGSLSEPLEIELNDIHSGIVPSKSSPNAENYVLRDHVNYYTPNLYRRNVRPDLSLRAINIPRIEIPVEDLHFPNRDSLPSLDTLDDSSGNRLLADSSALAIRLIQPIFPKIEISRAGAVPMELNNIINSANGSLPPERQERVSRSGTDPKVPVDLEKDKDTSLDTDDDDDDDDDDGDNGDFRIIGGNAATGSGTPLSNRGRSGKLY